MMPEACLKATTLYTAGVRDARGPLGRHLDAGPTVRKYEQRIARVGPSPRTDRIVLEDGRRLR